MPQIDFVSFDTETRGVEDGFALQPCRARTGDAWLTMCAMSSHDKGTWGWRFDGMTPAARRATTIAAIKPFLEDAAANRRTIVGWNTPFDMGWLIAMGLREEVYACKWLDAMLLWKHLTISPEWTGVAPRFYGLKAAVAEFLPHHAGYQDDINFFTDDPEELEKLFTYNKADAQHTLTLAHTFWHRMTERQQRMALIEAACLPMVAEAYVEGIQMNREKLQVLEQDLIDKGNIALVTLNLRSREEIKREVVASPTKLRKLLHEDWGLPVVKVTEKGVSSTDRDALTMLAGQDDRALLLNTYREARGNCTKFATGALASLDYNGDGRVRPNASVFSTYTARMTYRGSILRGKDKRPTGVPLHQWKRDKTFRDPIEAPEGYTLLEHDFAGQEFRWMGVMSKDNNMIRLCQPGEDAHTFMGANIDGANYRAMMAAVEAGDAHAKSMRQLGKVGNLSCQYRTSANTLRRVARVSYGLMLSDMEAAAIHATYRTSYPRVMQYWKDQINAAREDGFVETISGRRVWLKLGHKWEDDEKWGLESTAINTPIQGSGADQKYLALAVLKPYLERVGGRFYFELHDGLFSIVPTPIAERCALEIKELLSNLPYHKAWGVNMPIAFPVDAKMGPTWGTLKELK